MSNTNCSVHGCNNTQKNTKGITPKVRFFCFPSKPQDKVRKSKYNFNNLLRFCIVYKIYFKYKNFLLRGFKIPDIWKILYWSSISQRFFKAASRSSGLSGSKGNVSIGAPRVFRPLGLPQLWGKDVLLTLAAIFKHNPAQCLHWPVMPALHVQCALMTFRSLSSYRKKLKLKWF